MTPKKATPMTAREKAIEIVANIQGWKREDYERPRDEITRMHGGAEFNLLTEAIERALLDTIEECAKVVESKWATDNYDERNIMPNVAAEIRKMGVTK